MDDLLQVNGGHECPQTRKTENHFVSRKCVDSRKDLTIVKGSSTID